MGIWFDRFTSLRGIKWGNQWDNKDLKRSPRTVIARFVISHNNLITNNNKYYSLDIFFPSHFGRIVKSVCNAVAVPHAHSALRSSTYMLDAPRWYIFVTDNERSYAGLFFCFNFLFRSWRVCSWLQKGIKRLVLASKLISLCEKLRLSTSLAKHLSNDKLSHSNFEASVIEQTIEHFNRYQLFTSHERKISVGSYLLHSISTLLKAKSDYYFSCDFDRLTKTSKMKDLLLNKLIENDILISEQRNNYTNGISNGR